MRFQPPAPQSELCSLRFMFPAHPRSIEGKASDGRSLSRYFLLLFGLCLLIWLLGPRFDVQLFPGFKLFQAGLAMPMIAALLTI
jgi:hypothetical protein